MRIIAVSQKGDGMLPMKQSPELEDKKSYEQRNAELCNFIKNAFCVNGDVSLVKSDKEFKAKVYFVVEDSDRGNFIVALSNLVK
jgi:hypothetical protein